MTRRDWMIGVTTAILLGSGVRAGALAFDIEGHGAVPDTGDLQTKALQAAIDAAHAAGGGTVRVGPGVYRIGTVELKSRVHLYLEPGATIQASDNPDDYTPRHLFFARDAEDIAITGLGRLDGHGRAFWTTSAVSARTEENSYRWVALWDTRRTFHPGRVLYLERCRNVRLRDFTIVDAPSWTIDLLDCDDVVIDGITMRNRPDGLNTDGIDLTGCRNVRIANCDIHTGDDAVVIKSPANRGSGRPNENIVVTNCVLRSNANGFKIGTESYGGFRSIAFSNSVIYGDDADVWKRGIAGIAIMCVDGGFVEDVTVSNIAMHGIRTPFAMRLGNRGTGQDEPVPGTMRRISLSNITAAGATITPSITGLPGHPIEDVTLRNIRFTREGGGDPAWADREIPELPGDYPEAIMYGRLPAYALFARDVNGLTLDLYECDLIQPDPRPAFVFDRVERLRQRD